MKSRLALAIGAVVPIAAAALLAAPAANSTPSRADDGNRAACPRGSGVTVLVDYGATTAIRCAPGDPTTGLKALTGARYRVTYVQRFPGAVCRINGIPSATKDACVVMPPTTRYWSYWHAKRGGTWVYATVGAASFNPAPGSVDGWAYGAGKPPSTPVPK